MSDWNQGPQIDNPPAFDRPAPGGRPWSLGGVNDLPPSGTGPDWSNDLSSPWNDNPSPIDNPWPDFVRPDPDAPPPPDPWSDENRNAYAALASYLEPLGLSSMLPWIREQIIDGVTAPELRLKFFDHPAFRQRFPIYDLMREAGWDRHNMPDPAQVIQYENGVRSLFTRYGIDPALAAAPQPWDGSATDPIIDDQHLVSQLLLANKDLGEVEEVIREGYRRVVDSPPLIRAAFAEWYGVAGVAMLAMHFIAPSVLTTDELLRQAQTAEIGGYARRQTIDISETRARAIALSNVSASQAMEQFGRLDEMRALFNENLDEGTNLRIEAEGVEAAFGLNAGAQGLLRRRLAKRVASDRGGSSSLIEDDSTSVGVLAR